MAHAVQVGVLECVDATSQLHASAARERARSHRLELELFDARTALAQAGTAPATSARAEQRTQHHAPHDELTSLPNRSFLGAWLEQAVADTVPRSEGLAMLHAVSRARRRRCGYAFFD